MEESKQNWKRFFLTVTDHVILATIVAPLTVMYWWSVWSLLDHYMNSLDKFSRGSITCLVGLNGMTLCYCIQDPFTYFTHKYNNLMTWIIFNHLYCVFFALCNVCHWHGVWNLCDLLIDFLIGYWGDQLTWTAIFLTATVVSMMIMRQLTNVRAPPVIIVVDVDPNVYKITTRFNRSWQTHGSWFILDCAFTACIVHSFVVLFWRNSWVLWDLKMEGYDLATDSAICVIIAYIVTLVVFVIQIPVSRVVKRVSLKEKHWMFHVVIEQLLTHLWAGEAAVALWRGCWLTYDCYIQIPEYPIGGYWLGCTTGLGLLMAMMAAISVIASGGDVDGACEDGSGAILTTRYFRYFQDRKITKEQEKDVMVEMTDVTEKLKNGDVEDVEVADAELEDGQVGDQLLNHNIDT